jgi:hypothetical protein
MTNINKLKTEVLDHWQTNLLLVLAGEEVEFFSNIGATNCPYCKEFWNYDCIGCPIYNTSNEFHCQNTPYDKIDEMVNEYEEGNEIDGTELIKLVCKEIEFLESL